MEKYEIAPLTKREALNVLSFVITEAFLTVMTGDRHDELAALDLSITPS